MMTVLSAVEPGQTIQLDSGAALTINRATQRRWSRVGFGQVDGRDVFVKQFIDATGRPHRRGFDGELQTAELVSQPASLPIGVTAIPILDTVADRLIAVSPSVRMQTWDDLAAKGAERRQHATNVGRVLAATLRHRCGEAEATSWKGMDPKNVGLLIGEDGQPCSCAMLFDFGPPTATSMVVAAGRVAAFAFAAPLTRKPGRDVLLGSNSAVREVIASMRALTTEDEVDRQLRHLFDHRATNGGRARSVLAVGYHFYRRRALSAWRQCSTPSETAVRIDSCSVHYQSSAEGRFCNQGNI